MTNAPGGSPKPLDELSDVMQLHFLFIFLTRMHERWQNATKKQTCPPAISISVKTVARAALWMVLVKVQHGSNTNGYWLQDSKTIIDGHSSQRISLEFHELQDPRDHCNSHSKKGNEFISSCLDSTCRMPCLCAPTKKPTCCILLWQCVHRFGEHKQDL